MIYIILNSTVKKMYFNFNVYGRVELSLGLHQQEYTFVCLFKTAGIIGVRNLCLVSRFLLGNLLRKKICLNLILQFSFLSLFFYCLPDNVKMLIKISIHEALVFFVVPRHHYRHVLLLDFQCS